MRLELSSAKMPAIFPGGGGGGGGPESKQVSLKHD